MQSIEEYAVESSINKVACSEALDYVVDEMVQIYGGYGYSADYPAEKAYRDSRINRIYEGTNEINRMLIPGQLLKRAMKGKIGLMQAAKPCKTKYLVHLCHLMKIPDFWPEKNALHATPKRSRLWYLEQQPKNS